MSTLKQALPPYPPWLELPEDITAKILQKLGLIWLLFSAQSVCTIWRKICRDRTMWRVVDMWKLADNDFFDLLPYGGQQKVCRIAVDFFTAVKIEDFGSSRQEKLCRLAVDLSRGQVTTINIEDFGFDSLLDYIAERCAQLRCLRLAFCNRVYGYRLSKAVKGFPLLEELHLESTPVEKDDIRVIGQSCPMLKTFALNACRQYGIHKSNEEALAMALYMPELRHLQLFRNGMTNKGLEAILNGCSKLVSLDLRECFNLNLEVDLGNRCAQQIQIFRRPDDPTDDYEWYAKICERKWEDEDDALLYVPTNLDIDYCNSD